MSALTLEDLQSQTPLAIEAVPVPEFGEGKQIHIAELGANESEARIGVPWTKHAESQGNNSGFRAFAIAACWCDDKRSFVAVGPSEVAKAAAVVGKCSRKTIERIYEVVARLNGLDIAEDSEKN